jgi:hypothetical protein
MRLVILALGNLHMDQRELAERSAKQEGIASAETA